MEENNKGNEITAAFHYIQQFYSECQRMILKLDNLMAPDWNPIWGKRVTSEISSSLMHPNDWLANGIFRIYECAGKKVYKGITINYCDDVEEPIITVGKITYKNIKNREYWDLYNSWYYLETDNNIERNPAGNIITLVPKKDDEDNAYIREVKAFSLPLISIETDFDVETKIYKPLVNL